MNEWMNFCLCHLLTTIDQMTENKRQIQMYQSGVKWMGRLVWAGNSIKHSLLPWWVETHYKMHNTLTTESGRAIKAQDQDEEEESEATEGTRLQMMNEKRLIKTYLISKKHRMFQRLKIPMLVLMLVIKIH